MATAPIIHAVSHAIQKDVSLRYAIPNVTYTHVLLIPTVDVWLRTGDSTVVAAPGADGNIFLPANTITEFPTRRHQVEGITHLAVYGSDVLPNGFLNVNYGNLVVTEIDCLAGIYHMMREQLIRQFGEPGYSPQHPPFKSHIDW